MRNTPLPLFIGSLAALACASPQATSQQPPPAQATEPASSAGMTVVRDRATGTLRTPTPAEAQALQAGAALTPFQPALTTGADGRRQVKLGEHGMVHSVVRRDADGAVTRHCTHDADAAIAPQSQSGEHHETR